MNQPTAPSLKLQRSKAGRQALKYPSVKSSDALVGIETFIVSELDANCRRRVKKPARKVRSITKV